MVWSLKVLEYLDQGVTVFDQNLNLVAWNQRFIELLELPDELMRLNQNLESIFRFNAERGEYGEGDIEQLVAERIALAKTFKPHVFDRVRPDGTIIEIRGNPMPAREGPRGFVTTYTDVTRQRNTETTLENHVLKRTQQLRKEAMAHEKTTQALKESERLIRQITDAVPALIAYIDNADRYQFINKKHSEWFALREEELLGKSIFGIVENRNRDQLERDLQSVRKGELVQSEYCVRGKTGESFNVSVSFIPHFDEDQQFSGYFFLGQDLTEYQATQKTLMESQKMQALGQMTGGIAHDFNNLLTIILGNLNLLEEEAFDQEEVKEISQSCVQAARRGSELIQRLLSFSRQQALEPQSTDINLLTEDFMVLLQRTMGEKILIECRLEAGLKPALIDPNQLQSCLINLTLNARDAMPEGGTIIIRTQSLLIPNEQNSKNHQKQTLPPGHYISLTVEDNGEGMTNENIRRAFEPFFSTKPPGVGTGLGLSMVYGFVNQSGGNVVIDSKPGSGTIVSLFLPAFPDTQKGADDIQASEPDLASLSSPGILLIEDDDDVRRYVKRALGTLGYKVTEAENGETGLQMLRNLKAGQATDPENGDQSLFDLVLTDIVMPGRISGLDIYQYASNHLPETSVLCMTGYSDRLDAKIDRKSLIQKPFQTKQLADKLGKLLRR
ncbi:MAG: PAS domain S-box protein [Gammaproteobacteria bacterium]|nr:PAS domain S-box protein [Gammaproteobacteria bacterium]